MTTKKLEARSRIGHISVGHLIRAMLDGPATAQELADASGLKRQTIYEFMRSMRKVGAAHICGWEPDCLGRVSLPVFKLGPGRDTKRQKKTPAERAGAYRERKRLSLLAQAISSRAKP